MSAHTELQVEFTLHEFSCSPHTITEAFGISPTAVWLEGDAIPPTKVQRKSNGWSLRSFAETEVADLEPHIRWLLSRLPEDLSALTHVCGSWYAEISVVAHVRDGAPVLHLPADLVGTLGRMGVAIDVDLYVRRAN